MQEMKLRLAKQQRDEVELQRLGEKIDTEKFMELAESFNVSDEETKVNTEGLETRLKAMEELKKEYEEELVELKEENESNTEMIGVLMSQHRTVNDELEDARKLAVLVRAETSANLIFQEWL